MSFTAILQYKQRIDAIARSLIGMPAFSDVHVLIPDSNSPESCFIRATSWLYCLYFESGSVSCKFLRDTGSKIDEFDSIAVEKHIDSVRCLRTELHHNLGFQDSDLRARTTADVWKRRVCGTALPNSDTQWNDCYEALVDEAKSALKNIEDVVRSLESRQGEVQMLLDEWSRRLNRTVPPHLFDPIIEDVKRRMGRESLSTVNFRNTHLSRWRKELELLDDGYYFEREASLLIEKTLLDDGSGILPITGKDIIEFLGVQPGRIVGDLLQEARLHCQAGSRTKEQLLACLKKSKLLDALCDPR